MSVTLITTQSTFSLGNGVLLTGKVSMSVWIKKKKYKPSEPGVLPHHHSESWTGSLTLLLPLCL